MDEQPLVTSARKGEIEVVFQLVKLTCSGVLSNVREAGEVVIAAELKVRKTLPNREPEWALEVCPQIVRLFRVVVLSLEKVVAIVEAADVAVLPSGSPEKRLGFARANRSLLLSPGQHEGTVSVDLVLPLSTAQLSVLEDIRNGGDLRFRLLTCAEGFNGIIEQSAVDDWHVRVHQSEWTEQLRNAKAMDILLLEVPLPGVDAPEQIRKVRIAFTSAQAHFLNANYKQAVATCREVLEMLGHHWCPGDPGWANSALDRLSNGRGSMTQREREIAVAAAVRHYTHEAHHVGKSEYERRDAKLCLALTASLLAYL